MSKKHNTPLTQKGELSEKDLEKVAGGQEVRKMGTIVVTAKREQPDIAGTKIAQADAKNKKN